MSDFLLDWLRLWGLFMAFMAGHDIGAAIWRSITKCECDDFHGCVCPQLPPIPRARLVRR